MRARDELVNSLARRYAVAGRAEKARILDEIVAITGFHRKHAMRLLRCDAAAYRVRLRTVAARQLWDGRKARGGRTFARLLAQGPRGIRGGVACARFCGGGRYGVAPCVEVVPNPYTGDPSAGAADSGLRRRVRGHRGGHGGGAEGACLQPPSRVHRRARTVDPGDDRSGPCGCAIPFGRVRYVCRHVSSGRGRRRPCGITAWNERRLRPR